MQCSYCDRPATARVVDEHADGGTEVVWLCADHDETVSPRPETAEVRRKGKEDAMARSSYAVVLGREVVFTGSKRSAEKWRNAHGGMIVYAAHLKLGDKLAVAHLSREEET